MSAVKQRGKVIRIVYPPGQGRECYRGAGGSNTGPYIDQQTFRFGTPAERQRIIEKYGTEEALNRWVDRSIKPAAETALERELRIRNEVVDEIQREDADAKQKAAEALKRELAIRDKAIRDSQRSTPAPAVPTRPARPAPTPIRAAPKPAITVYEQEPVRLVERNTRPWQVILSDLGRREIFDAVRGSSVERVGGLYGNDSVIVTRKPLRPYVTVFDFVRATPTRAEWDLDETWREQASLVRSFGGAPSPLAGIWHSHPGGGTEPSEADLDLGVNYYRMTADAAPFVMLIVAPSPKSRYRLDASAWGVSGDRWGEAIYQRLDIDGIAG